MPDDLLTAQEAGDNIIVKNTNVNDLKHIHI